mgnify:CR=1 FL=1
MQNLLIRYVDTPQRIDSTLAIAACIPAMIAMISDFPPVWVVASLVYAVVGYTSFANWSRLLVSWWSGWVLLMFIYAAVQLLPVFNSLQTTYLLAIMTVIALGTFGLLTIRNQNVLLNALAVLPVALELGRFALFRDLSGGLLGELIMTAVAVIVYVAIILALTHGRSSRNGWWLITVGIAVYGVTAIIASWPMILGYVLLYTYLPLLFMLFSVPLFGPVLLQNFQRLSRLQAIPQSVGRITLSALMFTLCAVITAVFLFPSVSTVESAPLESNNRQKIIIDTDMSFDDYVALLYLLQHPEIEVVGISSVHGVSTVTAGTENIRRLLQMTGHEEIPVSEGAAAPLEGDRAFPTIWTTVMDSVLRPSLPPVTSTPLPSATALMGELIAEEPQEIMLVALGPLTNVADLFQQMPETAGQLDSLVVGAGIIEAEHPTPEGEIDWNMWLDPVANEIVLAADVPTIWTPFDLTHYDLRLDMPFVEQWRQVSQQPEMTMMVRIPWMMIAVAGESQAVWDLVTAVIVTNPEICDDWRSLPLRSIQGEGETAGFLIVSEGERPNASVCMSGDQEMFEAAVLAGTR